MSVSLEKRTEAAHDSLVSLLKAEQAKGVDLGELVAQVIIAVDFSGSMATRYAKGEVQAAVERALALSLAGLDDDGEIQVFFFADTSYPMESVSKDNYQGFVDSWRRRRHMGGTCYAPTIRDIVTFVSGDKKRFFGRRDTTDMANKPPVFVIFVTDGEPFDKSETIRELMSAAKLPIFWQFLGLGYSPAFLRQLDTMDGRTIDNVGLTSMNDTLNMSDEQFFGSVIREFFSEWLPQARSLGLTRR